MLVEVVARLLRRIGPARRHFDKAVSTIIASRLTKCPSAAYA